MGEASILEMYFSMLPKAVAAAAEPIGNVDKMVLYGDGAQTKLIKDTMTTVSQIIESVKESAGIDLSSVIGSYLGTKQAE